MANKIKYGLKNVHYAKYIETVSTSGDVTVSYATPVSMPGGVNLSLAAEGTNDPFYADDSVFYNTISNNGYSGDLEIATIPDSFRKDILNETEDNNGLLVEKSAGSTQYFALLFEFQGDDKATRHVLYKCSATRPNVAGQTVEDTITPQTETLSITAVPTPDGYVKARALAGGTNYNTFFTSVQKPQFT